MLRILVLALLVLIASAAPARAGQWAGYAGDAAHTGVSDETIRPPLRVRWTRTFGLWADPSIVVAEGVVAVVAPDETGDILQVMDGRTGEVLWSTRVPDDDHGRIAYGDGRIYLLSQRGKLLAHDARSGRLAWERDLGGYHFMAPPVFHDGDVYLAQDSSGSHLLRLDAATGVTDWSTYVPYNNDFSAPALVGETLYTAVVGPQIGAFGSADGVRRWANEGDGVGGGSETPAVADGRLYFYSRFDGGQVFSTADGSHLFDYPATSPPTVHGATMLVPNADKLDARDAATGALLWTVDELALFGAPPEGLQIGDPYHETRPIVVGGLVYAPSDDGQVAVLDPANGSLVERFRAGDGWIPGLAAGEGILVVASGAEVVAYEQAPREPPSDAGAGNAAPGSGNDPADPAVGNRLRIAVARRFRLRAVCRRGLRVPVNAPSGGDLRVSLRRGRHTLAANRRILAGAGTARIRLEPRAACRGSRAKRASVTAVLRAGESVRRASVRISLR